jgi:hypothetical protein
MGSKMMFYRLLEKLQLRIFPKLKRRNTTTLKNSIKPRPSKKVFHPATIPLIFWPTATWQ